MQINRRFVKEGTDPFSMFEYESYDCKIVNHKTGKVKLDLPSCTVPKQWSINARDTVIDKYFRKAAIPFATIAAFEDGVPGWLQREVPRENTSYGPEKDIRQVINRIVGHLTYTGFREGYFEPSEQQMNEIKSREASARLNVGEPLQASIDARISQCRNDNARAFYDEVVYMMLNQMGAPNSPQWFNTGLYWAYGLKGNPSGHWYVDLPSWSGYVPQHPLVADGDLRSAQDYIGNMAKQATSSYERVQAHACYILNIEDTMMGEAGIYDWVEREARIFKYGSGSGANVSKLRAEGEPLSVGGKSSGMMSWIEIADRSAGAIKSGGTTRRAAKMICLDLDHPDVLKFVQCKVESEIAVASMVAGSSIINGNCKRIAAGDETCIHLARSLGVPENYVQAAIQLGQEGKQWPDITFDSDYEGRAYQIVPFQNANHSVRVPSLFYQAVELDADWNFIYRTSGEVAHTMKARLLEDSIAYAAWFSADPGVQYETTINEWHTCPNDAPITASNPCSEYMFSDDTACNLASNRLTQFLRKDGRFSPANYAHAVRLWTILLDITNSMAALPDRMTAINTYLYRNVGLGYADLGAMLMAYGIPYGSEEGQAFCGAVTALMQGVAWQTSGEMAKALGAYPRYEANREPHMRVIRNHMAATNLFPHLLFDSLTVRPLDLNHDDLARGIGELEAGSLLNAIHSAWDYAEEYGKADGFRNAQVSVLAPTGTIGIAMDCDTTGVEPVFSLDTMKKLVGGSKMQFSPVASVPRALRSLNYGNEAVESITEYFGKHKRLPIRPTENPFFVEEQHLAVFATALQSQSSIPAISWEHHIYMMASAQSFISGAISKTINMPRESTVEDVRLAYRLGHGTGCKAVALYRDNCKLSQPLTVQVKDDQQKHVEKVASEVAEKIAEPKKLTVDTINWAFAATEPVSYPTPLSKYADPADANVVQQAPPVSPRLLTKKDRMKLPPIRRPGTDVGVKCGEGHLYVKTSRYEDGQVGEIWITYSGDHRIQPFLDHLCKLANVSLQYGVPLEVVIKTIRNAKFDPAGVSTDHPYIKSYQSILDLAAKLLSYHELNDHSVCNKKPEAKGYEFTAPPSSGVLVHPITIPATATATVAMTTDGKALCPECGSDKWVRSGATCHKCLDCGHSPGCG
jgi:ribonucleoside-diphosphate reductase alpha chain